jgi:hypothetical protein
MLQYARARRRRCTGGHQGAGKAEDIDARVHAEDNSGRIRASDASFTKNRPSTDLNKQRVTFKYV